MFWGPGVFGYGTQVLWGSLPKNSATTGVYSVTVDPGSKTVRRRSDLPVTAHLQGFTAPKASLWARYASSGKWEEAPMQVQNGGAGFSFIFVGLPEDVDYYVEAGGIKSPSFKLHTVDLPGVKNIRVTYNYPVVERSGLELPKIPAAICGPLKAPSPMWRSKPTVR